MNVDQFTDWMPIRVYRDGGRTMVDWCYLGAARFTDPFFVDTIEKRLVTPFNLLFRRQTPIEALAELQRVSPGLAPTGFIFHMSRCGSTLVLQMLAALPQHIVISEAVPIDLVLGANFSHPEVTDEERIAWLRGIVGALARPRANQETHFFIKFDSWHVLELPLIERAFPGVPWIFLYRNPIEVIVSQHRQHGLHLVPAMLDPGRLGLDWPALTGESLEDYEVRVLARLCQAALQHRSTDGLLVNYRQLPDAVYSTIARHFQIEFSSADIERLRRAAQFDAKDPTQRFEEDSRKKNRAATDGMRRLAAQYLDPLYEQLEVARTAAEVNGADQPLHLEPVRMEQVGAV